MKTGQWANKGLDSAGMASRSGSIASPLASRMRSANKGVVTYYNQIWMCATFLPER